MALTVKQFEDRFCALTGEDRNVVRYTARVLQAGGVLPLGKRGLSRNARKMTVGEMVRFVFGFYGSAETKNAAGVAETLAAIPRGDGEEITVADEFTDLIASYRGDAGNRLADVDVWRLVFQQSDEFPKLTVEWRSRKEIAERGEDAGLRATDFQAPVDTAKLEYLPVSFKGQIVSGSLFDELAKLADEIEVSDG